MTLESPEKPEATAGDSLPTSENPAPAIGLANILCCPRCQSELSVGDEYRCTNSDCELSKQPFPFARGKPVLIDFARSIVRPADLEPETPPRHALGRWRDLLVRLSTPKNHVSDRVLADIRDRLVVAGGLPRLLIVGGGVLGQGVEQLYEAHGIEVVAIDIYASDAISLLADGHHLPFRNATMDAVVIQAVLEHVLSPREVVAEIHRVLKPNGIVFADSPFIYQVHGGAYDFTRFTMSGHRWLFKDFTVIEAGASLGAGTALIHSIRYFARALTGSGKLANLLALVFFWLRFLDGNSRNQQDAASGVYFYGSKSGQTLRPADMIEFYEQRAATF